jgi:hypothetical protein
VGLSFHTDIEGQINGVETDNIPVRKKFKPLLSAGKVFMAFWDTHGFLLLEYLDHETTVNADHYCTRLKAPEECYLD